MTTYAATASKSKTSDILRQFFVIVAFIGTVVVNALATLLPINGLTTGELSDRY